MKWAEILTRTSGSHIPPQEQKWPFNISDDASWKTDASQATKSVWSGNMSGAMSQVLL